jgi:Flp pilus assembly pilin Flp
MSHRIAATLMVAFHQNADRARRALVAENGQGTVEYAGLAMAIGVLLLAVGSYLGGKDHGIGSVVPLTGRPKTPGSKPRTRISRAIGCSDVTMTASIPAAFDV